MSRPGVRNTVAFALTAALVIAVDQVTKAVIIATFTYGESFTLIPGVLKVTRVENTGAAFSLFAGNSGLVFWVRILLMAGMVAWFYFIRKSGRMITVIALGLMLGGALGNIIDRLARGKVIDFFDLGWWPVFNVADLAIVAGVIIVLITLILDAVSEWRGGHAGVKES